MTDPWTVHENILPLATENSINSENINIVTLQNDSSTLQFEDNFEICENIEELKSEISRLPDSDTYLESLEKKLRKLRKHPQILEQLARKREECLDRLINDNSFINKDESIELDAPLSTNESAVHELYRHICPVQPLSVGETVHIVEYDQLEEQSQIISAEAKNQEKDL